MVIAVSHGSGLPQQDNAGHLTAITAQEQPEKRDKDTKMLT